MLLGKKRKWTRYRKSGNLHMRSCGATNESRGSWRSQACAWNHQASRWGRPVALASESNRASPTSKLDFFWQVTKTRSDIEDKCSGQGPSACFAAKRLRGGGLTASSEKPPLFIEKIMLNNAQKKKNNSNIQYFDHFMRLGSGHGFCYMAINV